MAQRHVVSSSTRSCPTAQGTFLAAETVLHLEMSLSDWSMTGCKCVHWSHVKEAAMTCQPTVPFEARVYMSGCKFWCKINCKTLHAFLSFKKAMSFVQPALPCM